MSTKLTWASQAGQSLDSIKIYRSNSYINPNSPGTPLATLAATATEYVDSTVLNNNIYHYRVVYVKGADNAFGDNQIIGYYSDTGPGPQTIQRGTWELGYFGELTPAEFWNFTDLKAAIPGATTMTINPATTFTWMKLAYKGKILFVPNTFFFSAVSFNDLYVAGLIFGVDGGGDLPVGVTTVTGYPTNQKVVVSKGEFSYMVRAPKNSASPTTTFVTTAAQTVGGEFRDIISPMHTTTVIPLPSDYKPRYNDQSVSAGIVVTQHSASVNTIGMYQNGAYESGSKVLFASTTLNYRPVLELVLS